jgi:peptidoglycan/LPS O-acetylase OafA/YrhL
VTARFPLMDSIRALAAISILLGHALARAGVYESDNWLGPYAARLDSGVAIFFVVSGCLLYRPFVVALAAGEHLPSVAAYAWRRALRIYPAYWVALTVVLFASGLSVGLTLEEGYPQYLLAQIYGEYNSALPQAWTLCVEVSFYAFVPAFAALLARRRTGWLGSQIVAIGTLVLISLAWKLGLMHWDAQRGAQWLPAYLDQFALGMALAVLTVWMSGEGSESRWPATLRRWSGVGWLVAGAAFLASTHIGLPSHFTAAWYLPMSDAQTLGRHALMSLIGIGVAVPAVLAAGGVVHRVLGWRPLLYLGKISYGIYLWQFLIFNQVLPAAPSFIHPYAWYSVGGFAATVVLAALSYRYVEAPAMRLRHLSDGPGARPSVTMPT